MTLLGICITNAFRMYEMEYRESGRPLKGKFDFTTFLDKLAYELIFNNSFQISSGFTKRGINEVSNSSSNSKNKKTKKKHKERKADDDGDDGDDEDDEDDEDGNTHRLISFAQKFPDSDKKYSQTVRLNCKQCNTHRTSYFCLDCSEIDDDTDPSEHIGFAWLCSPATSASNQCYAKHVLGSK